MDIFDSKGEISLLPLRTNLVIPRESGLPLSVYTVGTEHQQPMTRLTGFSAKQLFFTLSGSGSFRPIGQDNWDILQASTMLYIPDHLPHEYRPEPGQTWHVGYVTFLEREPGSSRMFGLDQEPFQLALNQMDRIADLLEKLWLCSGPEYDPWLSSELLYTILVEIRKQAANPKKDEASRRMPHPLRYRDTVVDRATQFLYDHMQLRFSLKELASYVGYSPKQVIRLFKEVLGVTPLEHMQRVRMETAAELLKRPNGPTVSEVAAFVGMDPIYFTRLFRRKYGIVPSKYRNQ